MSTEKNKEMITTTAMLLLSCCCCCCAMICSESFVIWLMLSRNSKDNQRRISWKGVRSDLQASPLSIHGCDGNGDNEDINGGELLGEEGERYESDNDKGVTPLPKEKFRRPQWRPPSMPIPLCVRCCPFPLSPPRLHLVGRWRRQD